MMRAFVTGAAGFAGSYLTEHLLACGREVFGLVLDRAAVSNLAQAQAGERAAALHLVEGELCDERVLADAVRDSRPDEIYHLAAQSSVRRSLEDPALTFQVNVLGTQAVLEAACRGADRARILCVGSADAYGESARAGRRLEEGDPLLPVSPYGSSKAAAEEIARRYGAERGLHVVRVRPFPHTGPRHSAQFVYPDLARQLCEIRAGRRAARIEIGHAEVRRDLSDARDVAAAYVLSLERGEAGAVYNVCSGRSVSVREALQVMMDLSGVSAEVVVQADRLRPHDLETLEGSSRALRARTGWAPRVPLETTLRDLLVYWEARSALAGGE
jgi:GDP-4-dehydro-6-deoxy-D-mannose reductase